VIVVRVELWPRGNPGHKRTLGTVQIANDCSGDTITGNYRVSGQTFDGADRGAALAVTNVAGHDRRTGFWTLVERAIAALRAEGLR